MVTITTEGQRQIVRSLLTYGSNHRREIVRDINRQFVRYAVQFIDRAAEAKRSGEELRLEDWYRDQMLMLAANVDDAAVLGGVPRKTVFNIYGKASRQVVLDAAVENIQHFLDTLEELRAALAPQFQVELSNHGVTFTTDESMLLINSLAVKRQQINGGMWSAVGKSVEHPLMHTLCELFGLGEQHYRLGLEQDGKYQVDFILMRSGVEYRCEVKLNGRGNPESVTGAIARDARVVIADYISEQNRKKLDSSKIAWVDLSERDGYLQFGDALIAFSIPHTPPADLRRLDGILDRVLPLP